VSPRLTPEERVAKEMQKLKAMGVTITTRPAHGVEDGFAGRPMGIVAQAAKDAGIYYYDDEKKP